MSEHLQKAAEFLQDAIVHADSVIDATSNITHERRAMENTAFAQAAAAIAQAEAMERQAVAMEKIAGLLKEVVAPGQYGGYREYDGYIRTQPA